MACEKEFGVVDACINLAYQKSSTWGKSFEDISSEQISNHLNLQLGTCILLSQRFIKYFISQRKGNLIFVLQYREYQPLNLNTIRAQT